ncbi:hypothetical protein SO694_00006061 [Aureococcus anophagefferens]|uniref:Beta-hexosaminidase bacterial type N-terminal domain-containing protein n=1 Tax=Aureococcus anophagefferens TaxID=44056 RepID=A0ABR1GA71_AURAN
MAAAIVMRFVGLLLLLTHAAVAEDLDELWLRSSSSRTPSFGRATSRSSPPIRVSGDAGVSRIQLETAAQELRTSLGAMLGATIECCDAAEATLAVTVGAALDAETGAEGFALTVGDDGVELSAATASGALYGVFDLLSTVRRGEALRSKASAPAMDLRIWDLWGDLTGDVTRGYAGDSLIWPMAMWRDPNVDDGPGKTMLYVAPCDDGDANQRWSGVFDGCARRPPEFAPTPPLGERDYQNQQFTVRDAGAGASTLRSVSAGGQCLTLLNAYPPSPAAPKNVSFTARLDAMLRLLKSAGVNGIVLNDVANASYGSSNYSDYGLGCDRTSSGTGYAEFYAPEVRDMFEDVDACP